MGKEIERKWLFNYEGCDVMYLFEHLLMKHADAMFEIKDFYFNDTTRLRNTEGVWEITVKSNGTLIRDEFNFQVCNESIDFIPAPMLRKQRYYMNFEGYDNYFEMNIFHDIWVPNNVPLILIEYEMSYPTPVKQLPIICGREVTEDSKYYGYNLFKIIQEGRGLDSIKKPKLYETEIIPFKKPEKLDNK